jgi:ATP-binding cassette, subfamily B, bacterial PglK
MGAAVSNAAGAPTARKLWRLLSPSEHRAAIGLLGLMLAGMALETLGIGLVVPVIALLTQPNYSAKFAVMQPVLAALGNPDQQTLILGAMFGLIGVFLVKNLFLAFLAWRETYFSCAVQARLSLRLFSLYLYQPYTFHLERNSAQLIRNTITEVGYITGRVLTPTLHLVSEGLVLVGLCTLLLVVEPVGALIVVVTLGLTGWGFHYSTRARMSYWGLARQKHEGLRIQHLQQGFGGAKDVKLLGRERHFLAQYAVHNTQSAKASEFHATLQQLPRLGLEFLAVVGVVIVVVAMMAQGRDLASVVPTMGLFAAVAFRLMPSVNRIIGAVQSLRYGLPAIDTLYEELRLCARIDERGESRRKAGIQKEIALASVGYSYPTASTQALKNLTLSIRCGESVGFIGPSGSGKSTLVNVILGLLTPASGKVLVDGEDIQTDLRGWQDQIGYVPQSIFLTDDTLRRNVAFSLPDDQVDDAAVWRAIRAAQLEQFVASLPQGLETMVGERGVRISGGQRQRIGIARALYHDPAVLVLDEATSALDTETERGVMEAVTAFHGAKTTLIVAHRLSTVEQCDRLYRLDHGEIVEEIVERSNAVVAALQPARSV